MHGVHFRTATRIWDCWKIWEVRGLSSRDEVIKLFFLVGEDELTVDEFGIDFLSKLSALRTLRIGLLMTKFYIYMFYTCMLHPDIESRTQLTCSNPLKEGSKVYYIYFQKKFCYAFPPFHLATL